MDFITVFSRLQTQSKEKNNIGKTLHPKMEGISVFRQIKCEYDIMVEEITNPLRIENIQQIEDAEDLEKYNKIAINAKENLLYPDQFFHDPKSHTDNRLLYSNVWTEDNLDSPYGIKNHDEAMSESLIQKIQNSSQVNRVKINGVSVIILDDEDLEDMGKEDKSFFPSIYGTNSATELDAVNTFSAYRELKNNEPKVKINYTHENSNNTPEKRERVLRGIKMNTAAAILRKTNYGTWKPLLTKSFDMNGGTLHISVSQDKEAGSHYNEIKMFFDDKSGELANLDFRVLGDSFKFENFFEKIEFDEDPNPESNGYIYDIINDDAIYAIIAQFVAEYRNKSFQVVESITKNLAEESLKKSLLATPKNLQIATEILMGNNSKIIPFERDMMLAFNKTELNQIDGSSIIILDIADITDIRKMHRRVMILPNIDPIAIMVYEHNEKVMFGWQKIERVNHMYNNRINDLVRDASVWNPERKVEISRSNLIEFLSIGTQREFVDKIHQFIPNPLSKTIEDIEAERIIQKQIRNHDRKDVYSMVFGEANGSQFEQIVAEVYRSIEKLDQDFIDETEG